MSSRSTRTASHRHGLLAALSVAPHAVRRRPSDRRMPCPSSFVLSPCSHRRPFDSFSSSLSLASGDGTSFAARPGRRCAVCAHVGVRTARTSRAPAGVGRAEEVQVLAAAIEHRLDDVAQAVGDRRTTCPVRASRRRRCGTRLCCRACRRATSSRATTLWLHERRRARRSAPTRPSSTLPVCRSIQ